MKTKYGAYILGCASLLTCINCGTGVQKFQRLTQEGSAMSDITIKTQDDVFRLFPKTSDQVHVHVASVIKQTDENLQKIISSNPSARTFQNTAQAFDLICDKMASAAEMFMSLELVYPDESMRTACHESHVAIKTKFFEIVSDKKVYAAFKSYVDGNAKNEKLNDEQRYFLQETMRDFKRQGLDLPDEQLDQVKSIRKELTALEAEFEMNTSKDSSHIKVPAWQLAGLEKRFVDGLEKDNDGLYRLGCDYPTYTEVMEYCSVSQTRKQLFRAFNNRAYPINHELLEKIIAKRDQLAKKLGFASYAALDIDSTMAQNVDRVQKFLVDLGRQAKAKTDQEYALLIKHLPDGVTLDDGGRLYPWDVSYVKACYKKKMFNVDARQIAEYFPAEQALQGIFDIYQTFLNLKFTISKPSWSWHDDVRLIQINDRATDALKGFIFLDLYPRPNKYSHACIVGVLNSVKKMLPDGGITHSPAVGVIIANFPKSTATEPALLKHGDVETFFHEFGHAMHFVHGSTELASLSGLSVKCDFVEVPSQLFEEWMFDKDILTQLGRHYKTGQPLPTKLIDNIIALKKFDSGSFITRQCVLSLFDLEFFKEGEQKPLADIVKQYSEQFVPQIAYDSSVHMWASFGHLIGYGAKYYSYMWSKVYALDLFECIKRDGLTNPETGKRFASVVLAKAGSVDPNILLKDYLGREPNSDAFIRDLGLTA